MKRRPTLLTFAVLFAVIFAASCKTSDDANASDLSEKQAEALVNDFYLPELGVVLPSGPAHSPFDLFVRACRPSFSAPGLGSIIRAVVDGAPGSKAVDGFDVGPVRLEKVVNGTQVTPEDPARSRVRIAGEWITLAEFGNRFGRPGLSIASTPGTPDEEPLVFRREFGQWLVSSCKGPT